MSGVKDSCLLFEERKTSKEQRFRIVYNGVPLNLLDSSEITKLNNYADLVEAASIADHTLVNGRLESRAELNVPNHVAPGKNCDINFNEPDFFLSFTFNGDLNSLSDPNSYTFDATFVTPYGNIGAANLYGGVSDITDTLQTNLPAIFDDPNCVQIEDHVYDCGGGPDYSTGDDKVFDPVTNSQCAISCGDAYMLDCLVYTPGPRDLVQCFALTNIICTNTCTK